MGLALRIWTFDLEHHGGTFIFSRPELLKGTPALNSFGTRKMEMGLSR